MNAPESLSRTEASPRLHFLATPDFRHRNEVSVYFCRFHLFAYQIKSSQPAVPERLSRQPRSLSSLHKRSPNPNVLDGAAPSSPAAIDSCLLYYGEDSAPAPEVRAIGPHSAFSVGEQAAPGRIAEAIAREGGRRSAGSGREGRRVRAGRTNPARH
jgi:hypothetical protein